MNTCPECGGAIVGTPRHCEFVDCPLDREADAPAYTCREADEAEMSLQPRYNDLLALVGEMMVYMPDHLEVPGWVQTAVEDMYCQQLEDLLADAQREE